MQIFLVPAMVADGTADEERRQRAKARWRILRSALLGEGASSVAKAASIHRFRGFQMLPRRRVPPTEHDDAYTTRLRSFSCVYHSTDNTLDETESMADTCTQCCALFTGTARACGIDMLVPQRAKFDKGLKKALLTGLVSRGFQVSESEKDNNDDKILRILWRIGLSETHSETDLTECVEYTVPINTNDSIRVRVRERIKSDSIKIDLKALTSHRHYGVDNTGNACVWDSESTLTYCLMRHGLRKESPAAESVGIPNLLSLASQRQLCVVELGAGMAGLAGLALATIGIDCFGEDISVKVRLTDGHPESVRNNQVNAQLTKALYSLDKPNGDIGSSLLLWKDSAEGASECAELISSIHRPFDLCLASDCIHFQEFHAALMLTMARLVRVDGIAVLCQPHRGTSLNRFVALLQAVNERTTSPLWQIRLLTDYDETISRHHREYLEKDSSYDPSIHYAMLLVLRKLRPLEEESDRLVAVKHMEERDAT